MKKRLIALLLVLALVIPASVASAAGWYRVTTSSVKVRLMASESAQVLGSYRRDYALTVKNTTKDGWSYVVFSNGFEGYVESKYIGKSKTGNAWVAYDDTALRRGPDGDFSAIAVLAKGRKVKVLSYGNNYDYVDAGSMGKGYIVKSRLSSKSVKASGNESKSTGTSGGDYDAYVVNAGARKVNLRQSPSESAPVIASYPSATLVHVISHGGTWDKVEVNGNTGYMMTKFLTTSVPAPTATPTPEGGGGGGGGSTGYTAYVTCPNKGTVNVRRGEGPGYATKFSVRYGAEVTVLKHGKTWDYIRYNGKEGYIMNKFLQTSVPTDVPDPSAVPDPSVTPTPKPEFQPYDTTVNTDKVNFHKQAGSWSSNVDFVGLDGKGQIMAGETVTVLGFKGEWAHVEYAGRKGWILKKFLN